MSNSTHPLEPMREELHALVDQVFDQWKRRLRIAAPKQSDKPENTTTTQSTPVQQPVKPKPSGKDASLEAFFQSIKRNPSP